MATKKKAGKRGKDLDVHIKVNNLEKAIKSLEKLDKKDKSCKKKSCHAGGCGFWIFGSALAMVLSYAKSASIGWAILHGIISWIYVIYRVIVDYGIFG
jgi:hypothetical protein